MLPPGSTVVAAGGPLKALVWEREELRAMCVRNPSITFPLTALLSEVVAREGEEVVAFSRLAVIRTNTSWAALLRRTQLYSCLTGVPDRRTARWSAGCWRTTS